MRRGNTSIPYGPEQVLEPPQPRRPMRAYNIRSEIYFKRGETYARESARFEAWESSHENKDAICAFREHLLAQGTGRIRVAKVTSHLRRLCDMMPDATLPRATKADVRALVARISTNEEWSEATRYEYKRILKHFYHWYENEDPRLVGGTLAQREHARAFYSFMEKGIRTARPRKAIGRDQIITDEDCEQLIREGCQHAMESALVAALHEGGPRIGELLGLRIHDYRRKGAYAVVCLDGKTGERTIPLVRAIPYLEAWLREHPYKDDPEALLWVSTHNGHYGEPLAYIGVCRLLSRVFARASLAKKANPHFFRHSRATLNAPHMSEAILCKYFGWTIGSSQPRTYVHLAAQDVEAAYLRIHGLAPPGKKQPCLPVGQVALTDFEEVAEEIELDY